MNGDINRGIFEAYLKSKTPILENKEETQQVIEEKKGGAKPDFLDIDGDGNKKESMKKAASDKKGGKGAKDSKKKGMTSKQAKYFGKKKKAVKESTNLSNGQIALRENFRNILQKNGLADIVTPGILKAMYEAFTLGSAINEGKKDFRNVRKEELALLKKKLADHKKQGKEIPSGLEGKVEKLKAKLNVN